MTDVVQDNQQRQDFEKRVNEFLPLDIHPHIRKRYTTLMERASLYDFGCLESDIVALDTETTGLSHKNDQLTQIAAVKLEEGSVADEFTTFVNPSRPIPHNIEKLTNIYSVDVEHAPTPQTAVARLADFVELDPILAHNASFDRAFIEAAQNDTCVSDTWIDTLALSRIAFPALTSHKLQDLAYIFGCESVTHRANDDCTALAGVWHYILTGVCDIPQGVLTTLVEAHNEVNWPYRFIFSYILHEVLPENSDAPFVYSLAVENTSVGMSNTGTISEIRRDLFNTHTYTFQAEHANQDKTVDETQTKHDFSSTGCVAQMFLSQNYEVRPTQQEMAVRVTSLQNSGQCGVLEVGTGVGKSLAYLLPSVSRAVQNDIQIGVATKTNALAEQLVKKELPHLHAVYPKDFSYLIVKGAEHYPYLEGIDTLMREEFDISQFKDIRFSSSKIKAEILTTAALIYSACCELVDVDVDSLGIRWNMIPKGDFVASHHTGSSRTLSTCAPHYMLSELRERTQHAHLVVTNHALLATDIALGHVLFPLVSNWIVDEAHGFADQVRDQWAQELSQDAFYDLFYTLGGIKTGLLGDAFSSSSNSEQQPLLQKLISKAAVLVARLHVKNEGLFDCLNAVTLDDRYRFSRGTHTHMIQRVDNSIVSQDAWNAFLDKMSEFAKTFDTLEAVLTQLCKVISSEASQHRDSDFKRVCAYVASYLEVMTRLTQGSEDGFVYTVERVKQKKAYQTYLKETCLDIGKRLYTDWYLDAQSVLYTSATLSIEQSFEYFNHLVGLDRLNSDRVETKTLPSPFDYESHMGVIVPNNLVLPQHEKYIQCLSNLLFDIHVAMNGSVLTLFTNRREMEAVSSKLVPHLESHGLTLLEQLPTTSAQQIMRGFKKDTTTSLVALKSFWEGVDAPGDTLRCVVIPRLPFLPPTDPIVEALTERDSSTWWNYVLPRAITEVRQAAGRLIRSQHDSGLVIIADTRVLSKAYGKHVLHALPNVHHQEISCENMKSYIQMWRKAHEE